MEHSNFERYIGQTVIVYTESGGLSGSGFTGVLIYADCSVVKLLCYRGMAPTCPHNACRYGKENHKEEWYGNPLGSVAVIPTNKIVSFTHAAL